MKHEILYYLQSNSPKAFKRRDLAKKIKDVTGCSQSVAERKLRGILTELQNEGHPITRSDKGIGYERDWRKVERDVKRYASMGINNLAIAHRLEETCFKMKEAEEELLHKGQLNLAI